jgi:hypothetical protein
MKKGEILNVNNNNFKHSLVVIFIFTVIYLIFFSPVLFSNTLLAPGDGFVQSVPAFYSSRTLWTPLLLGGFPVAADVTPQTWYPVSLVFSLIPNSWNAFVVSAYVLASSFSYGYIYALTQSRLAALVGGIIYGMSGFMMAHLGHTSMIHTAVWMPLLIWALEKLRHHFSLSWFAVGVCTVACSFLAGHPQIFVYTMGLSAVYVLVLGWSAPLGRWKYYRLYLGVLVLGVALAAIQIIPTIELANLTPRSVMSFDDFVSFSLPVHQAIHLIFPFLFGGSSHSLYKLPYFGEWNLTELAGYIGLLPLLLAVLGFLAYYNKLVTNFWFGVVLFTLLLTLGNATPLGQLMYHLPAYNKFRAPARHAVEMALAVSVLAGLGVASVQKQVVSNRLLIRTVLVSTGVIGLSLMGIFIFSGQLSKKVIDAGVRKLTFVPWLNPIVGIPLLIFLLAVVSLIYWSKSTQSKSRCLWLLLILILDLGSFGWFYEWHDGAPSKNLLTPTVSTQHYKEVLISSQQRMLPLGSGLVEEIPPNISRLWGVPSASGYGPLILSRVSELLSMTAAGEVQGNWDHTDNRSLDIMSVRYVFIPKPSTVTDDKGVSWSKEDMNISFGTGCGTQEPNSVNIQVPAQTSATAIGIVSSLGCSTGVVNNDEVVRILVTDANGNVVTQSLQAGRDTSEWAYECSDVLPNMQHRKAPIFESFPTERESLQTCTGHTYVSIFSVEKLRDVKNIKLEWVGSAGGISIKKISLINGKTQQSYPITTLSDATRWNHVEDINATSVYENLRAMPRAWLVPEVVSAKSEDILNSIKSSKLPDGRLFNPSKVALVKNALKFKTSNLDASATAKVVNLSDTRVEVTTNSSSPAFLVLSDVYYPGWKATVDGKNVHLFQTDYVLRGVLVPSGKHIVKFEFKPLSFHLGLGISAASLTLLGYLALKPRQNQNFIRSES